MIRVVILGATGSIGRQTLDIVAQFPHRFQVVGLAAHSNRGMLEAQAARFGVKRLALFQGPTDLPTGIEAIGDLCELPEADVVVVSVAGVIGLLPTLRAIDAGKSIALASKEVLVAAGELVMPRIAEKGVKITPIDSEHSAVFQCLQGYRSGQVDRLILTASGGPFRGKKRADLEGMKASDALRHPTWKMGGKITIDSATLMNKGLETIEARWLFDIPIERVDAVIHPQSIVHSFVKFTDGSVLAQLGKPDMRLPILYALSHPDRWENRMDSWDPTQASNLTFEPVDHETFPSLKIAARSVAKGGTAPCAMNAANEEAANAFLRDELGFLQVFEVVEEALERHKVAEPSLDNLLETDKETRRWTQEWIATRGNAAKINGVG